MRAPVSTTDLEAVELSAANDAPGQRAVAELLESWALGAVPGDSVSRGRLLVAASEHAAFAGDGARALRLARQALGTGDHVSPDTRCYVVSALLVCGHLAEAVALAEQVLRERAGDVEAYLFLGEEFAWHRQPEEAQRVYTQGLFRCSADEEAVEALLGAWRRGRGRPSVVDLRGGLPAPSLPVD
ncbi:tetratricopeptide repeat protein [Kineococcus terrestris]|uniref:tetratricopeptide repeat protein n=1 Tax=Kineococcus terrestris TaxID=2044856 RepID=UPI0034DB38A0